MAYVKPKVTVPSKPAPKIHQRFLEKNPKNWYHVDATGHVVGKLAQKIVHILSGKHKPTYHHATDHAGDYVVVTNAEKMVMTGYSWYNKEYIYHTGRPGGLKRIPARDYLENHPERLLIHAVKGMLPKNNHRWSRLDRLKIFADDKHPYNHLIAISKPAKQINFDRSLYKDPIPDPEIHSGYVMKINDTPEKLEITFNRTPGVRPFRIKSLYKPPTLRKAKDNGGLVKKKPRPLPRLEEFFPELLKAQGGGAKKPAAAAPPPPQKGKK